jgi:hypothetical protein
MKEMSASADGNLTPANAYVIGRKSFAAISAVEGLELASDAEVRLERTHPLPPEERRAETIRAFASEQKRA